MSLLDLPRARTWRCHRLRTPLTVLVEFGHILWLVFAFAVFTPETKSCVQGNLLMTYLILFIMMIGFLHVIKVIMYAVACLIGWVFDGQPVGNRELREPLNQEREGLTAGEVAKLRHCKYMRQQFQSTESNVAGGEAAGKECTICCVQMADGDDIIVLPCHQRHFFHK